MNNSNRDIAVRIRELTKVYQLAQQAYGTLFQYDGYKAVRDVVRPLDGINLDVYRGEALAILGRNGAGKSTLLKILARITPPTSGTVDLYGDVSALLEVGAGFHSELTGRENVFLNGALLGIKRKEIEENIGAIADFSEIGKYLDVPVKYYSRGMHLRLAFSVAAHLKPEILLLDEVFAVGDAHFQEKCLRKIAGIKKEGKTVLFVTHTLDLVEALADRAILIENGKIVAEGIPSLICPEYLSVVSQPASLGA